MASDKNHLYSEL